MALIQVSELLQFAQKYIKHIVIYVIWMYKII